MNKQNKLYLDKNTTKLLNEEDVFKHIESFLKSTKKSSIINFKDYKKTETVFIFMSKKLNVFRIKYYYTFSRSYLTTNFHLDEAYNIYIKLVDNNKKFLKNHKI